MPTRNDLTVELLSEEHLAAVAEVEAACFSTPWSVASLRMLTESPNVAFVAKIGDRVVGYGGMQCILDEGQITDIAVLPEYRRRGIAAELLERLLLHARENGLSVIFLEVRESNLPALSLYRDRFGFEVIGVRRGFYTHPKEDAYNMRLLLTT